MIGGKKVVVVLPAYNAETTLERTVEPLDREIVDDVVLVDDHSSDATVERARRLGLRVFEHRRNLGYGGNQKTCYREALRLDADIVVMVHPDYQYEPRLVPALAGMVASDVYDVVLGSRILGRGAIDGGMPRYKYFANRVLTLLQNLLIRQKVSEYHTGLRAFSSDVLLRLPLRENSDGFLFDNQILAQALYFGFRLGEVSCPTKYHAEASSIGFRASCRYGLGVLWTSLQVALQRTGLARFRFLSRHGRRLEGIEGLVLTSR